MNKHHKQGSAAPVRTGQRKGVAPAASVNEKPGFPGAQLPGGMQKRDRDAGVKPCPTYPDSKGLC